jgi:hypothetical protein
VHHTLYQCVLECEIVRVSLWVCEAVYIDGHRLLCDWVQGWVSVRVLVGVSGACMCSCVVTHCMSACQRKTRAGVAQCAWWTSYDLEDALYKGAV